MYLVLLGHGANPSRYLTLPYSMFEGVGSKRKATNSGYGSIPKALGRTASIQACKRLKS